MALMELWLVYNRKIVETLRACCKKPADKNYLFALYTDYLQGTSVYRNALLVLHQSG